MSDTPEITHGVTERPAPSPDAGYFYDPNGEMVAVDQVRVSPHVEGHLLTLFSNQHTDFGAFVVSTKKLLRWVAAIDQSLAAPIDTMSIQGGHLGITCQLSLAFAARIRAAIVAYRDEHDLQAED